MRRVDVMMADPGHIYLTPKCVTSTFEIQCEVITRKRHSQKAKKETVAVKNQVDQVAELEAWLAAEDTLLAEDVAMAEDVAEKLALDEILDEMDHKSYPEYLMADFLDGCACEGTYGLNDEGEVAYHDCGR